MAYIKRFYLKLYDDMPAIEEHINKEIKEATQILVYPCPYNKDTETNLPTAILIYAVFEGKTKE